QNPAQARQNTIHTVRPVLMWPAYRARMRVLPVLGLLPVDGSGSVDLEVPEESRSVGPRLRSNLGGPTGRGVGQGGRPPWHKHRHGRAEINGGMFLSGNGADTCLSVALSGRLIRA